MKGDASCHLPNDKYRENYDQMRWNSTPRHAPGPDGTTPDEANLTPQPSRYDWGEESEDRGFWP